MAQEYCTLLVSTPSKVALPSQSELQSELESADVQRKVEGLKKAILLMLSGEESPRTLMAVIRYCVTVEDHALQKLLMLYWEVARKYDAAGKLLPEMILVCNALRNNLIHPNEYIRGCTLRFLCKLREPELLEPLVPSIKACLTHRHPYVRRNAVLAVFSVSKNFQDMFADAAAEIEKLLEDETDAATRRNAFIMLFQTDLDRALQYLYKNLDRVMNFGDGFSLVLLDLIRKVARNDASKRTKFLRIVFALLTAPSSSVSFEAAGTLVTLSAAPSAIRAAAAAYIKILNKESDNNVKLIVLDRLSALRAKHTKSVRDLVMDILRALSCPNNDIRKRTLDVAMELVYPRNVDEVMALLKKEIISTSGASSVPERDTVAIEYRGLLISAIHGCAVRFPDVASNVIHLLMDFLNGEGAVTVIELVREIVETYPELRATVMNKLRDVMPDITASEVFRVALWLLGQYSQSEADVSAAFHVIRECIGPLPLHTPLKEFVEAAKAGKSLPVESDAKVKKGPVVLADGTYASQSAARAEVTEDAEEDVDEYIPTMRRLLLAGDFFLGAVVASTFTKLALRVTQLHTREDRHAKSVFVDAMLVMCAIIELGSSGLAGTTTLLPATLLASISKTLRSGGQVPSATGLQQTSGGGVAGVRIDQDSFERIVLCMRVLGDPSASAAAVPVLLNSCQDTFRALIAERRVRAAQAAKDGVTSVSASASGSGLRTVATSSASADASEQLKIVSHVDDCLNLRLLRANRGAGDDAALDDGDDVSLRSSSEVKENFTERLKRIHQLTGFADSVYAEAYVQVHEFDILLEILLINRTDATLTNVVLELSTMGDLRLVDRPASFTLAPKASKTIKANIKVASTETGHIFGTIVYDGPTAAPDGDRTSVINLAELHVDIMDYIHPAVCSDSTFRSMWADFEWENKVNVSTNITNLQDFVRHIAKQTNMRILTPIAPLIGSNFLAANLYARSVFGEDALVNVSVENKPDGSIRGHVRIRAKTQGVALALGDRITAKQKQ